MPEPDRCEDIRPIISDMLSLDTCDLMQLCESIYQAVVHVHIHKTYTDKINLLSLIMAIYDTRKERLEIDRGRSVQTHLGGQLANVRTTF